MANDTKPKKSSMPLMTLIPTVAGAVLGPNFTEDRLSVMFGMSEASLSGAAWDGAIGGGAGALVGFAIGYILHRLFEKSKDGMAPDGE